MKFHYRSAQHFLVDIPNLQSCDLCNEHAADLILTTSRLDGPLVRCLGCGLYYVVIDKEEQRKDVAGSYIVAEMNRLAERALELALIEPQVEERERPWRELMASERIADLRRVVSSGRLLEVGSSTGELLAAASKHFTVTGIEADVSSSNIARTRGLDCLTGTLFDARFPSAHFDVAVLYHTIEHLPSPRAVLAELHRIVRPGGWVALETPDISTIWFRLLGARWRQFIPDHRYFFTPETICRLCCEAGFEVRDLHSVGKAMSLRLFVSRVSRYSQTLAQTLRRISCVLGLEDKTLRLNLGDVMRLYAQKSLPVGD